jgi:small conductance mechanosensitive channel
MARATQALQTAMQDLQADEEVKEFLIGEPVIVSWNNLTEWAVQVRLMARTLPGRQWAVGQALRRCAMQALAAAGLRVALPPTVSRSEGAG